MLIEMHAHSSRYSPCSHIDPVPLVRGVVRKGLQGVIITEHHYLWGADEIKELRKASGVEDHFLILAAQEVETDFGHVIVYGAQDTITERMSLRNLRAAFPDSALIWAHPLRNGKVPSLKKIMDQRLDAIEIFSSNHTLVENYLGLKLWHQHRFTAVSGSDSHAEDTAGIFPTLFDHPVSSITEVASEIRHGRCRPFYKEIPKAGGNMLVQEITLGTKGQDESRSRIILKRPKRLEKWVSLRDASRIASEVHDHGFSEGTFRVPRTFEINEEERLVIEEGQRGKSLFDVLVQVSEATGKSYFELAARWLGRLHAQRISFSSVNQTKAREKQRFASYEKAFERSGSPYLNQIHHLIATVKSFEEGLFTTSSDEFVLLHGDYHPKNIIIGQDKMQDISTLFISVIDFGNAMLFSPAFDVGYFLEQFQNQLRFYPRLIKAYRAEEFTALYLDEAHVPDRDEFLGRVNMFRIRAGLSIGTFLIRVGKGESEDMSELMKRLYTLLEE
jgi:thiamine kinase-like enzyme